MMISEQNLSKWAERYRNKQLSPAELEALQKALQESDYLMASWKETLSLLALLDKKAKRDQMRRKVDIVAKKNKNISRRAIGNGDKPANRILSFTRNNILKLAGVAAALMLVSSLLTFWVVRDKANTNNGTQYTLLRREIENIKHSQSKIMDSLQRQPAMMQEPIYGGTGFAITNNGYVATNYHVVKDAHAIYIQTASNETFKSYIVAFEPKADVAILKIEDSSFRFGKAPLPYRFAHAASALGQQVFTLGYPQDDLVYNEGYISCERGFDNDSASYQLEMVANPGQSGAPVLDKSGNIIALVTGKRSNTSGTTYAVHSRALLQLIQSLPDSTQNKLQLPSGHIARNLTHVAQVKRIRPYICSVKVN